MKHALSQNMPHPPTFELREHRKSPNANRLFERFLWFKGNDQSGSVLRILKASEWHPENAKYALLWDNRECIAQPIFARDTSQNIFHLDHADSPKNCSISSASLGNLPFSDEQFDWVFCDGVIQHVVGFERQYLLLRELMRIAKRGVFVTTVNRWHPIEFNTSLLLLHWLPVTLWRTSLKLFGKSKFSRGNRLNLLSSGDLKKLTDLLPGRPKSSIGHLRFFGLKAHFFLQLDKSQAS
ncbi:MAG: methyltransferase domain-containing protein [Pseudomonadota bacterium]